MLGDGFWLNCSYDLENDGLYSIKWFKLNASGSNEFYRFLPNEIPQIQVYNSTGVYFDQS
ncbi:cell adhesion molecule 2-like protein [Leptotrombidium deliense]|uniref:Cell adhesion molecule 2-like protein n=1 Tax=Leptotrombidium deliense TaxID=299467 RepID=A0A443RYE7_9ACAR|nr:cell adhesion molecule 2-like protein [Leptotrombidium deliense]